MKKLLVLTALLIVTGASYSQQRFGSTKDTKESGAAFFQTPTTQTFAVVANSAKARVSIGDGGIRVEGDSMSAIKHLLLMGMMNMVTTPERKQAAEDMFKYLDARGNISDSAKYQDAFKRYIDWKGFEGKPKNKVYIDDSKNGQFYYTVTGDNNEVLVTSETQKQKQSIKKGIAALAEAMKDFEIIDRTKPKSKKPKK